MSVIKRFIKDNWWAILTVICFIVLGMVIGAIMQTATDVIAYYVTHALIAD